MSTTPTPDPHRAEVSPARGSARRGDDGGRTTPQNSPAPALVPPLPMTGEAAAPAPPAGNEATSTDLRSPKGEGGASWGSSVATRRAQISTAARRMLRKSPLPRQKSFKVPEKWDVGDSHFLKVKLMPNTPKAIADLKKKSRKSSASATGDDAAAATAAANAAPVASRPPQTAPARDDDPGYVSIGAELPPAVDPGRYDVDDGSDDDLLPSRRPSGLERPTIQVDPSTAGADSFAAPGTASRTRSPFIRLTSPMTPTINLNTVVGGGSPPRGSPLLFANNGSMRGGSVFGSGGLCGPDVRENESFYVYLLSKPLFSQERHATYAVLVGRTVTDDKYSFRVIRDEVNKKTLFVPVGALKRVARELCCVPAPLPPPNPVSSFAPYLNSPLAGHQADSYGSFSASMIYGEEYYSPMVLANPPPPPMEVDVSKLKGIEAAIRDYALTELPDLVGNKRRMLTEKLRRYFAKINDTASLNRLDEILYDNKDQLEEYLENLFNQSKPGGLEGRLGDDTVATGQDDPLLSGVGGEGAAAMAGAEPSQTNPSGSLSPIQRAFGEESMFRGAGVAEASQLQRLQSRLRQLEEENSTLRGRRSHRSRQSRRRRRRYSDSSSASSSGGSSSLSGRDSSSDISVSERSESERTARAVDGRTHPGSGTGDPSLTAPTSPRSPRYPSGGDGKTSRDRAKEKKRSKHKDPSRRKDDKQRQRLHRYRDDLDKLGKDRRALAATVEQLKREKDEAVAQHVSAQEILLRTIDHLTHEKEALTEDREADGKRHAQAQRELHDQLKAQEAESRRAVEALTRELDRANLERRCVLELMAIQRGELAARLELSSEAAEGHRRLLGQHVAFEKKIAQIGQTHAARFLSLLEQRERELKEAKAKVDELHQQLQAQQTAAADEQQQQRQLGELQVVSGRRGGSTSTSQLSHLEGSDELSQLAQSRLTKTADPNGSPSDSQLRRSSYRREPYSPVSLRKEPYDRSPQGLLLEDSGAKRRLSLTDSRRRSASGVQDGGRKKSVSPSAHRGRPAEVVGDDKKRTHSPNPEHLIYQCPPVQNLPHYYHSSHDAYQAQLARTANGGGGAPDRLADSGSGEPEELRQRQMQLLQHLQSSYPGAEGRGRGMGHSAAGAKPNSLGAVGPEPQMRHGGGFSQSRSRGGAKKQPEPLAVAPTVGRPAYRMARTFDAPTVSSRKRSLSKQRGDGTNFLYQIESQGMANKGGNGTSYSWHRVGDSGGRSAPAHRGSAGPRLNGSGAGYPPPYGGGEESHSRSDHSGSSRNTHSRMDSAGRGGFERAEPFLGSPVSHSTRDPRAVATWHGGYPMAADAPGSRPYYSEPQGYAPEQPQRHHRSPHGWDAKAATETPSSTARPRDSQRHHHRHPRSHEDRHEKRNRRRGDDEPNGSRHPPPEVAKRRAYDAPHRSASSCSSESYSSAYSSDSRRQPPSYQSRHSQRRHQQPPAQPQPRGASAHAPRHSNPSFTPSATPMTVSDGEAAVEREGGRRHAPFRAMSEKSKPTPSHSPSMPSNKLSAHGSSAASHTEEMGSLKAINKELQDRVEELQLALLAQPPELPPVF